MAKNTLEDYYSAIKKSGKSVIRGRGNYLWVKHEMFSVVRFPELVGSKPSFEEIRFVFKKMKCLLINYTFVPENKSETNAYLYNSTCYYNFEKLSKNVKRDINIGRENLKYGFATWSDILSGGLTAFSETRKRVGLSDWNSKTFIRRFSEFSKNPSHNAVAAWYRNKIIAFMSLIVVEDYVIIQGSFSTNDHRKLCGNNILVDFILNHFLNKNNYSIVCYGLSSIQNSRGNDGLHQYKIRVGFQAIPVKRIFIIHPYLKPFVGIIKKCVFFLLSLFPKNRLLRKSAGIFNFV